MKRKSFIVHLDSLEILEDLTDEQAGKLLRAMASFNKGEEISLDPLIKIAFSSFKNQFIRDNEKYEKTCKRRSEAGSKGGLAKASNAKQKVAKGSKTKQSIANLAESDSVSDSDSENESDSKTLLRDESLDAEFDRFWESGIRKIGKKQAKAAFLKILGSKTQKVEFTDYLIKDVQFRLSNEQLGFAELHPTTYLRNERWTDERRTKQQSAVGNSKPSLAERAAEQTAIIQSQLEAGYFDQCAMGPNDPAIQAQVDFSRGRENAIESIDAEFSLVVQEDGVFDR